MKRRILFSALIVIALAVVVAMALPRQEIRSDAVDDFDTFVTALIQENAIPGVAIAIIKDHEVALLQGFGLADVDSGRKMTADTPVNIASISKPIMGLAILQLAERGLLDLDTNVNAYLPFRVENPNVADSVITIRHLATHTSGIADLYDVSDFTPGQDAPTPLVRHLEAVLTPQGTRYGGGQYYLETRPGETREYSNLGAGVAGAVAEAVGQKSLNALMQESVFIPLGMGNSSWLLSDFREGRLATRYEVEQCVPWLDYCADTRSPKANFLIGKVFDPPSEYKQFVAFPQYGNPNYPDGGVHSSAADLTKLTMAILNDGKYAGGELLREDTFKEMLRLQLPPEISDRQRFFWRDRNGMTGHSGSDLGVYSSLYFDPSTGNAVIILMNRSPDAKTEMAMKLIMDRVNSDFLDK